ncbi:collagen alpha-2(I) chain-like isoform X1 [Heliangelus exortis]|uniref:collagen alpha-2(I) chain-like isoform X1 n=1 Tax=Heliangelus exortis TaxID=472823 RepID=UPI003A8D2EBB
MWALGQRSGAQGQRSSAQGQRSSAQGAAEQRLCRGTAEPCAVLVHSGENTGGMELPLHQRKVRRGSVNSRRRVCGGCAGGQSGSAGKGQRTGTARGELRRAVPEGSGAERRAGFVSGAGWRSEEQGGGLRERSGAEGRQRSGVCGAADGRWRAPGQMHVRRSHLGGVSGGCGEGRGRGPPPAAAEAFVPRGLAGGGTKERRGRAGAGASGMLPELSVVLAALRSSRRGPPGSLAPDEQARPGGTGWPVRWKHPQGKQTPASQEDGRAWG